MAFTLEGKARNMIANIDWKYYSKISFQCIASIYHRCSSAEPDCAKTGGGGWESLFRDRPRTHLLAYTQLFLSSDLFKFLSNTGIYQIFFVKDVKTCVALETEIQLIWSGSCSSDSCEKISFVVCSSTSLPRLNKEKLHRISSSCQLFLCYVVHNLVKCCGFGSISP